MAPQRKRRVTKNNLGDEDRVVTKSRVDVRETRGMAASRIRDTEPAAASNSNPTRPRDKRLEERSAAREKNLGDEDRAGTKSKVDGRPTRKASARRIQDEEPAAASTSNSHQPHEEPDSLVTTQNPGHEDRVVTKSRTHSRPTQGTAPDGTRDKRTRAEEAVEEGSLGRVDYESLSTEELRLKIMPFKIIGSGGMKKDELLQLCHLFCPEQTPESEGGQRAVPRLRARGNHNQGELATHSPELDDGSCPSVNVIYGSRMGSSRNSKRSASPDRGRTIDMQSEKESGRREKRSKQQISDLDEEEESDTRSRTHLEYITPANRRLTNRSEVGRLQESRPSGNMVDFPSRERGTALPRPRPTVLNSNDKGKQRAVSESEYDPEEEERQDPSEEDDVDEPEDDLEDIDQPDDDLMSEDDHFSGKEASRNIDRLLEDLEIPDADPYRSEGDDEMSNHGESERWKRLEQNQKRTDQNVSQIATAVRDMAEAMKQMRRDFSVGPANRARGTQAKKPQGGDFLRRIRRHIWTLMGLKNEGRVPPSASEQERSRWKRKIPKNFVNSNLDLEEEEEVDEERDPRFPYRGGPGGEDSNPQVLLIMWKMMTSVGVRSFRPIWEDKMSSAENKFLWQLATAIFIRLVQCGEYDDVTNGEAKSSVVYTALTKHARQRLQRSFREYNSMSRGELEARHKHGNRHSRLNVWKTRRCTIATGLNGMWGLCPLIQAATSDDETDDDQDLPADKQKRCRVLRLPWRSPALEDLLVRLDVYQDTKKKASPKGTRGAKPRIRLREDDEDRKESQISAPAGLPIDCYSVDWLSTLDPTEREDLEIEEEPALAAFQRRARVLGV